MFQRWCDKRGDQYEISIYTLKRTGGGPWRATRRGQKESTITTALALQDAERTSNVTSAACHLVDRAEETMSSGKEGMLEIAGSGVLQEQRTWDVVFSHLAVRNLLGTVLFVRARQVARAWLEAVNKALPLLASLSFPVHAKATDVVNVLMSVAGNNLKAVCLEGCLQLSAIDVERILQCLASGCPAVVEVNLAGCRDEAILRALATAAKRQFSAISPEELRAMLLALAPSGPQPPGAPLSACFSTSPRPASARQTWVGTLPLVEMWCARHWNAPSRTKRLCTTCLCSKS